MPRPPDSAHPRGPPGCHCSHKNSFLYLLNKISESSLGGHRANTFLWKGPAFFHLLSGTDRTGVHLGTRRAASALKAPRSPASRRLGPPALAAESRVPAAARSLGGLCALPSPDTGSLGPHGPHGPPEPPTRGSSMQALLRAAFRPRRPHTRLLWTPCHHHCSSETQEQAEPGRAAGLREPQRPRAEERAAMSPWRRSHVAMETQLDHATQAGVVPLAQLR